tara:strand:+ start:234 stop:476 length:243 start_codon:yes stop_codon:yes gene_type:complete
MIKNKNKIIILFLLFLIISACSSNDSSGPALVEISSDGEDLESNKGQEENGDEEDVGEEENRILYAGTRAGGVYWISLDG